MRVRFSFLLAWGLATVIAMAGMSRADDLLPPPYRGSPLGVEGHWDVGDGQTFHPDKVHVYNRQIPNPNETVWPVPPTIVSDGVNYLVTFPNWVDNEPLKLGRIQLYWVSRDSSMLPVMDPG